MTGSLLDFTRVSHCFSTINEGTVVVSLFEILFDLLNIRRLKSLIGFI